MITDVVILALILWGVAALFDEGMILEIPGDWLLERVPRYLLKPLFLCPACMSSVWGAVWALVQGYTVEQWIIVTLATCGLNYLIMKFLTQ